MPFKSEKQRKYMYAKHPEIAERWSKEGKGSVAGYDKSAKKTSSPKAKMAAAKGKAKGMVAAKKAVAKKRGK